MNFTGTLETSPLLSIYTLQWQELIFLSSALLHLQPENQKWPVSLHLLKAKGCKFTGHRCKWDSLKMLILSVLRFQKPVNHKAGGSQSLPTQHHYPTRFYTGCLFHLLKRIAYSCGWKREGGAFKFLHPQGIYSSGSLPPCEMVGLISSLCFASAPTHLTVSLFFLLDYKNVYCQNSLFHIWTCRK